MTANELLDGMLAHIKTVLPQLESRRGFGGRGESWLLRKPVLAGGIIKESFTQGGWGAKLSLDLYVPRTQGSEAAEELALAVARAAQGADPVPDGVERGALEVDKSTGALVIGLTAAYGKRGASGLQSCTVLLDGEPYAAGGWKVSAGGTEEGLTAIGEAEPFFYKGSRTYTIELQGLPQEAMALPDGFTVQVRGRKEIYENCRWKSQSAGGAGALVSQRMAREE